MGANRLDFSVAKKRSLEIVCPDGKVLVLVVKRFSLKQRRGLEKNVKKLDERKIKEGLSEVDHLIELLKLRLEPFDTKRIEIFDEHEILEILYAAANAQEDKTRTDDQKKTT